MDGYDTYSPAATKVLFDRRQVSHIFPGLSPEDDSNTSDEPIQNIGHISLSGAQSKFSVILAVDTTNLLGSINALNM